MRIRSKQQLYRLEVVYPNGMTRTVLVKASTREIAESRALKRAPGATSVKRPGE